MWVRSMLFAESEQFHANGLPKNNKKRYVCSECGLNYWTNNTMTDGAPHASKFFNEKFRDETCNGFLEVKE